jgi:hypothetical protein
MDIPFQLLLLNNYILDKLEIYQNLCNSEYSTEQIVYNPI